jgi:hypothetical protein
LSGCFLELFFEQGVNRIGFWTNANLTVLASSGDVTGIVAQNTVNVENANGTAGRFVGIERASNEVNFVQIFATSSDFVIDDLTYGRAGGTGIPEPSMLMLFILGSVTALALHARRARADR